MEKVTTETPAQEAEENEVEVNEPLTDKCTKYNLIAENKLLNNAGIHKEMHYICHLHDMKSALYLVAPQCICNAEYYLYSR